MNSNSKSPQSRSRMTLGLFIGSMLLSGSLFAVNTFTPTGGTVVSGYWNASNTGATVSVAVPNNVAIKYAIVQIQMGSNAWEGLGDSPLKNAAPYVNSTATYTYTASEIENASSFANGETFTTRVVFYNVSVASTGDTVSISPSISIDQTVPSISSVSFDVTSGWLKVNDILTMTINSSETGLTASTLTINAIDVSGDLNDNSDNTYSVAYTVSEGNNDIGDASQIPISITLNDAAGNTTGSYTTSPAAGSAPGIDANTPTISSLAYSPASGLQGVSDVITLTINSSETGLSATTLTLNGVDLTGNIVDNTDNSYTVTYTIIEGQTDISDAAQIPISITLTDDAGNVVSTTTPVAATNSPGIDAHTPSISSVAFSPTSGVLKVGDILTLNVSASEAGLSASGATVNGITVTSNMVDNGGGSYSFLYTIGEGETNVSDSEQIALSVTLTDGASNSTGAYTTSPASGSTPVIDANSPAISGVVLAPTSGVRKVGQTIDLTISAGESGLTLETLTFNGVDISATEVDAGGGSYTATYTVVEGNNDISDAAQIPIVIKYNDTAGNTTGNYTTSPNVGSSPGIDAHSPSITSVTFSPTSGTLKVGDQLSATISTSEASLTTITATINGKDVSSNLTDGGGGSYTALYNIAEGDDAVSDGAQIAIAFEFNDAAGNTTGSFTTAPTAGNSPAIDADSPSISSIGLTPSSGLLKVGDAIVMDINASETSLAATTITMNGVDVSGTLTDDGDNSYQVTYTIQEGNTNIGDSETLPATIILHDAAGNPTNTFNTPVSAGVTPALDANSPTITSVSYSPSSGTLVVGDDLTVTVNASEASLTAGAFTANGVDISGTFSDQGGGVYIGTYTVAEGNTDRDDSATIPVSITLNDAAGNTTGAFTTAPNSTSTPAIDAHSPTVSSVSFSPTSGILKVGQALTMTIVASETSLSATTITVNGVDVASTLQDNGSGNYSVVYTVVESNTDIAQDAQIPIQVILHDPAGNVTNTYSSSPVAGNSPAIDGNSPAISGVTFSPTSGLLKVGQDLTVTITTGESSLNLTTLTVNGVDISSTISDNSNGTYTATYTVVEGHTDRTDAAQIPIAITFTDAAGNTTGSYTTSPSAGNSPGIDANSPSISAISLNPSSGTLIVGQVLSVVVTASETGLTANSLSVNGVALLSGALSESGGGVYSITYTISEGDDDVAESATMPISITLEDLAGNTTNTYTTSPMATNTPTIDANSPSISLVTFSPTSGILGIGDTLSVTIISNAVGFTANTLKINTKSVTTTFVDAGAGTYTAKYIIASGDADVADNATIPVEIVLSDAAGNTNSTFSTSPTAPSSPAIDANRPTISGVTFNPTTGILIPGDDLTATVTASEASLVAGTITINGVDVASSLVDNGGGSYSLTYTIVEGQTDRSDAATIPLSIVLTDAAGNTSTAYTTSPVAGSSPGIDANSPTISAVTFLPTSGILKIGQDLTVNITASEAGLSANTITINGQSIGSITNVSGTNYTATYTVTEGDDDIDDSAQIPISITFEDSAGNLTNTYTTSPAAGSSPGIDANKPSIISVAYSPTTGTLIVGNTLTLTVNSTETGLLRQAISINNKAQTNFTDNTDNSYTVAYVVGEGDTDIDDSATIPLSIVIKDAAGNLSTTFSTAPGATSTPAIDAHAPTISSITFSPTADTLAIGDALTVTINASEAGLVAGAITVNAVDVASTLVDNSDNTYTLTYTVVEGNNNIAQSTQIPISIVLADDAGNNSVTFTTSPAATSAPAIDAVRPTISSISFSPTSGILIPDEAITMSIVTSETGLSATAIYVNDVDVASTFSSNGGGIYTVTYTISQGDDDISDAATIPISVQLQDAAGNTSTVFTTTPDASNAPGIDANQPAVLAAVFSPTVGTLKIADSLTVNITASEAGLTGSAITANGRSVVGTLTDLGGGSYRVKYGVVSGDNDIAQSATIPISIILVDDAGNLSNTFTTSPVATSTPAIDANRPTISGVTFNPTSGNLGIGESLSLTVTAGEAALSAGAITVNAVDVASTLVDNGDNTFTLTYTVVEGNNAIADNAQIPISIILIDVAGNSSTTFTTSPAATSAPAIDSGRPTITSISFSPTTGVLTTGETLTATVTASESGLSATAITMNGVDVASTFAASGGNNYTVTYLISEGDDDVSDAATIPVSIQLEDASGNTSTVYSTSPLAANSPGIDANAPSILTAVFSPSTGILKIADTLTVNITAGESDLTASVITVNGRSVNSTLSDLGAGAYRVKYGVVAGDADVAQSATIPISIILADSAGNLSDAFTTTPNATSTPAIDATRPVISGVVFSPTSGSLGIDDTLRMTITTLETGLTAGAISINALSVAATFADNADNTYTLTYVVSEGDNAIADNAQIPISIILIDAAGNSSTAYTTSPAATSCPAIDTAAPTVSNVSFTPVSGILVPGEAITATITASESGLSAGDITINGVAIDQTFNASGGNIYTVTYAVTEGDDDVSDAATIPLSIQLTDASGNTSNTYTTSPLAANSPGIDANAPVISSLYFTPQTSALTVGDSLSITVISNEPMLNLSAATVNGVSLSSFLDNDDNSYTLKYGIAEGDPDVASNATLPLSFQFADSAGNLSNLYVTSPSAGLTPTIDAHSPEIAAISTTTADGYRKLGQTVAIRLHFSEMVILSGGNLSVYLNSGQTLSLTPFAADSAKTVTYTVQVGDFTDQLTIDSLRLTAGTLRDSAGNDAFLTLPTGSNLADGSSIQVDGIVPTDFSTGSVTTVGAPVVAGYWNSLNTGLNVAVPVANDATLLNGTIQIRANSGSGWSNLGSSQAIATVNTNATIAITAGEFAGLGGYAEGANFIFQAILTDVAGNATTGDTSATTIHVDIATPTITKIISETTNGSYGFGDDINIEVILTEPVTLVGGEVRLTLETGTADAVVTNNSVTDQDTISFVYTVANDDSSLDLTASLVNLSAGTLRDSAGNSADLALPSGNNLADNADLVIDGIGPTISGITSTSADGWKKLANVVNVTVGFSESVTLSGGDTLKAYLNTGRVVNYTVISNATSTSANYTVLAGDSAYTLAVDSLVLTGGTLLDGGGNSVVLQIVNGTNLSDNNSIRIDGIVPIAFTSGTVTIQGTNSQTDYYNAADTAVVATVTPDIDDGSIVGGVALIQGRIGTAANFTTIGSSVTLTDRNPRNITLTSTQIALLPSYATGRELRFRTILRDIAGNETIGAVSADSVMIDIVPPSTFGLSSLAVLGGNVVTDVWNSTNTSLELDIPIANDATLQNGTVRIQVKVGGAGTFASLGTNESITGINTTQTISLASTLFSGFNDDDTLYFRGVMTDVAGNGTNGTTFAQTLVIDLNTPAAFTTGLVAATGGTEVAGYWNATNTGLEVTVPIDNTDQTLLDGFVYLEMRAQSTGTYEIIGDSTTITALSPMVIPVSSTDFLALTDYADGADIEVRAVISDLSYTTFGSTSASVIHIDVSAPIDSAVGALTPQSGTVVSNFWNATNTSLQVTIPFQASDLSMALSGSIQLQSRINNLPYVNTGAPVTVLAPVSPITTVQDRATIEALTGFGSGVDLYVRAQVTDNAGNLTLYDASQTVVRIDTTAPSDFVVRAIPMGDGAVFGRWNSLTDSIVVRVPLENDSTLLHQTGQVATVGAANVQMRMGGNPAWYNFATTTLISNLDDSLRISIPRATVIAQNGYTDGGMIYTRARIVDQAGNITTSVTSEDSLLIDISAPQAFTVGVVVTTGGAIVPGYWNAGNSGLNISVPIANDTTLITGNLSIMMALDGVGGEEIANVTLIGADLNTTKIVAVDSSVIENIAGFSTAQELFFWAMLTDRNGNSTDSDPSSTVLTVDQTAPDPASIDRVYDGLFGFWPSGYWNGYMQQLNFDIPVRSDDPSLIGGTIQLRLRTGANPFADFETPETIGSSGPQTFIYTDTQVEAVAGFTDGRYLDATFILTDNAGNSTSCDTLDNALYIDQTIPIAGAFVQANTSYDGYMNAADTLQAEWSGYSDASSGLESYQYAIGAAPKASNIVGWTTVAPGLVASVKDTLATLTNATTYYLSLIALDSAWNVSDTITTAGIYADFVRPTSNPVVEDYTFIENWVDASTISGSASDADAGLDSVSISIKRMSDSLYWSGSAWQIDSLGLDVSSFTATDWTYTLAPDSLTNRVTYIVSSRAIDLAHNLQSPVGVDQFQFVINTPPTLTAALADTTPEDALYTYRPSATDPDLGTISDDLLKFYLLAGPTTMTIDSLTGFIQWTPANADSGDTLITIRVADLHNEADTTSFVLTVLNVNDPPEPVALIEPADNTSLTPADGLDLNFTWSTAIDIDSQNLQYLLKFEAGSYDTSIITADTTLTLDVSVMDFPVDTAVLWYVMALDQTDTSTVVDQFNLTSSPPIVSLEYDTLSLRIRRYTAKDTTLGISNGGLTNLRWTRDSKPTWVSSTITAGVVAFNGTQNLALHLGTDTLATGRYTGIIQLTTNDPTNDTLQVLVDVTVLDKPELSLALYQNQVYPRRYEVMVVDSLGMIDSLHMSYGTTNLTLSHPNDNVYIAAINVVTQGNKTITAQAFSWAGDTTITRNFTVTLNKAGHDWLATSSDGKVSIKGIAGALAANEAVTIVDSALILGKRASYAVLGRENAIQQPLLVSMRDTASDRAIYQEVSEGQFEELPTLNREGQLMAWTEHFGKLTLGIKTIQIPEETGLSQNFPNPFNPETNISFDLGFMDGMYQQVDLRVYNILGQEVRQVTQTTLTPGHYNLKWNGLNETGQQVASGVYFARVMTDAGYMKSIKMVLLR